MLNFLWLKSKRILQICKDKQKSFVVPMYLINGSEITIKWW